MGVSFAFSAAAPRRAMKPSAVTRAIISAVAPPTGMILPRKQATGARYGGKNSVGVEWLNRAKIDNFNFKTFIHQLFRDRKRFVQHRACK